MPKGDPNENEIRTAQAQVESIPGAKIIHDYFLTKGFAYVKNDPLEWMDGYL